MKRHGDIIILGGGVIGLTPPISLPRRGERCPLCEQGETGKEASWAGAGILPPSNSSMPSFPSIGCGP